MVFAVAVVVAVAAMKCRCCFCVVVLLFMALVSESGREREIIKNGGGNETGCVGFEKKKTREQQTGSEEAFNVRDDS